MNLCFRHCRGVVLFGFDVYMYSGRVDVAGDKVVDAQGIGAFHEGEFFLCDNNLSSFILANTGKERG
jgi:hypothetical protein